MISDEAIRWRGSARCKGLLPRSVLPGCVRQAWTMSRHAATKNFSINCTFPGLMDGHLGYCLKEADKEILQLYGAQDRERIKGEMTRESECIHNYIKKGWRSQNKD